MTDFSVIFDKDNNRVGFARSNCDLNRDVTCCGKKCPGSSFSNAENAGATTVPTAPTPPTAPTTEDPDDLGPDVTVTPSVSPIPSFWQTNVRVISGLFFFLGIFFALFCACFVWLCCPGGKPGPLIGGNGITYSGSFQKISPGDDGDTEAFNRQDSSQNMAIQ
jgi:hypothetical protein